MHPPGHRRLDGLGIPTRTEVYRPNACPIRSKRTGYSVVISGPEIARLRIPIRTGRMTFGAGAPLGCEIPRRSQQTARARVKLAAGITSGSALS